MSLADLVEAGAEKSLLGLDPDENVLAKLYAAPGVTFEVSESHYWEALEILPPRHMGRGWFAFCEGEDVLTVFWVKRGRYFARRLTADENADVCREHAIPTLV